MSLALCEKLGYVVFKHTRTLIKDVNQATSKPIWELIEILSKIGNTNIPTYFIFMDIEEDPIVPILLGRGFLNTSGAILNMRGPSYLHLRKFRKQSMKGREGGDLLDFSYNVCEFLFFFTFMETSDVLHFV
jgi:hypothetical protein